MGTASPPQRLSRLFRRMPVAEMADLERALPGGSRRSLYRDLESLDYLASYSHTGRFYTLRPKAPFDDEGLWIHRGVGFSRHGTLKATSCHLVEVSEAGRTHTGNSSSDSACGFTTPFSHSSTRGASVA